ncbi:MAG: response regulator [Chloroflexota bacterium]|nr:response regulator [Chloroflexota bacterium]
MATILLVEDNEAIAEMMTRRLERRGYRVRWVADGAAALGAVAAVAPDLILMDMSLPVLDGWEATRCLKAAPATAAIPIIGLTAHAMSGDRARCLAAGCNAYSTKPVDFAALLADIVRLLPAEPPG